MSIQGLPGKSRAYFEQYFPELCLPDHLNGSGWWNRPFETEEECHMRAKTFLADLLTRHGDRAGRPENRVAIFSHGGFFIHLMCAILDTPWRQGALGMQSAFVLNNCSISRIDFDEDGIKFAYINRTDHLPDHLIT